MKIVKLQNLRLHKNILWLLVIGSFHASCIRELNPSKPMTSVDKASIYTSQTIMVAAKQMPEEFYTFRPTPELRSFGELMAHIAESAFVMVAMAKGEDNPMPKVGASKKEVIEALQMSFVYAAEARQNMATERKETMVKFMGESQPAGNILDFSVFHTLQHYGNVIVYMRLKGLVPPSSREGIPGNDPVQQPLKE